MRINTIVGAMTRLCTNDFMLPPQYPGNHKGVKIPAGTPVVFPVSAIHKFVNPNFLNLIYFNSFKKLIRLAIRKYLQIQKSSIPLVLMKMKNWLAINCHSLVLVMDLAYAQVNYTHEHGIAID